MTRHVGGALLGLGAGVALLLLGCTGVTIAAPTPISECTTIDTPGSYQLSGDVSNATADPCIEITAGDVVLDGAGHTVDGAGSGSGTGIDAAGPANLSNVTVQDVTVAEFRRGVRYQSVADGAVTTSTVTNNSGIGVLLRSTDDTGVTESLVTANTRDGVRLVSSTDTTIADVQSTANGDSGVNVASGSPTTTVLDSTVADNHVGIAVAGSDDAHVETTTVENNSLYGVSLESADGTHMESVTATDNGEWALHQGGAGTTTTEDLELASATVDTTSRSVALGPIDQSTAPPSGTSSAGGRVNATDTGAGA